MLAARVQLGPSAGLNAKPSAGSNPKAENAFLHLGIIATAGAYHCCPPKYLPILQSNKQLQGAYLFTLQGTQLLSIHGVHVSVPAEELGGLDPVLLRQRAAALLQQLLNGGLAIAGSNVVQHTHKLWVALTPYLQAGERC